MSGEPYLASEDSALLRRALKGRSGERCLEIGAGNGGNVVALSGKFRLVVGTDLVRPSMGDWREAGANLILADGASCIRSRVFDLVAFNPPYLRGEVEDRAVDGGSQLDVPKRFLREALRVAKKDGEVVFILSDGADWREFREICEEAGFALRPLASERVFFEELTVFSAKAEPPRPPWGS